jgi:hypothetical protein
VRTLPESHVATAADSDPWEVRRAREILLTEMRPSAELEKETKAKAAEAAALKRKRAKRLRKIESTMRRIEKEG